MLGKSRSTMHVSWWRLLIVIVMFHVASQHGRAMADSEVPQNILQKCHMKPFGCHKPPSGTVEVIHNVPDPETFYRDHIQTSTPILMKGGASHWPAVQKWPGNETYIVEKFGEEVMKVDYRKVWKNDYPKNKRMKIRDYLKIYREEAVYLDSPMGVSSLFYQDMVIPGCLACPGQIDKLTGMNMLYSSGNTSSVLHHDGLDNILTVVSGKKTVLVIHPKYSNQLYVNEFTVFPGLAPLDPEEIDLAKYPLVAEVDYTIAEMEGGDMLYVPKYWYHQVRSEGDPNIGLSVWFDQFADPCGEREEAVGNPDLLVAECTAEFLRCVAEQPTEISCKQGPLQPFSEVIAGLPQDIKEGWVQGYSGDMTLVGPVPDKKMASGYTIPVLGLGTARMYQKTYKAVLFALKSGYRMIDTAQSYLHSEESVGRAIRDSGVPRQDIFIITKLAPMFFGFSSTKKSVDMSLEKLGTDYIDLFLIHSPDCEKDVPENDHDAMPFKCPSDNPNASWEESWKAMEELHREGKLKSLGVSNFYPKRLEKLVAMAEVPVALVQNWFDPFIRDEETRAFCRDHGIVYQGYSTLGTQWAQILDDPTVNPILAHPVLHSFSVSLQASVAKVVLRWAIAKDVVVIPKAATENYILDNLNVLEFDLAEDVMNTIDDAVVSVEVDEEGEPILNDAVVKRMMGLPEEEPQVHIPDFRMPSGHTIPILGLGTAGMMDKTYDLVLFALHAGYRMIDTAQSYMNYHSEEAVGQAIKDSGIPREDIFLITKISPRFFGYDRTIDSIQESLNKLGMDYIDLLLIHDLDCSDPFQKCLPDEPIGTWEDTWKAMEEFHNKGKVRSLGVSNFYPKHLEKLVAMAEVPVSVVQNWFDPFIRDEATREFCEQHGIVYQGYSTLGGMWIDWIYRRKPVERMRNPVFTNKMLAKLSKVWDVSVANIVLRWAMHKGVVLIPKSVKEEHILNNLQVLEIELDEQSIRAIDESITPVKIDEDGQPSIYEDDEEWKRIVGSVDDREQGEVQEKDESEDQQRTEVVEPVDMELETIFVGSDDGRMYALDGETGQLKWKFTTEEDLGSSAAFSPDGSVVYFGTEDGHVNALRAIDGQVMWRYNTGGAVTCSPTVDPDGTVYVGTLDNQMYAFTPDGKVKWSRDLGGEIWTHPAVGHDGRLVYVGVMVDTNINAFALDSQTGTPAWSFKAGGKIWSSPVLSQDGKYVYFSCQDSHIYTLLADSGSLVRKFDIGEDHEGMDSSPVISRDGTLFVGTNGGSVLAVDIRRGRLRWEKMLEGEIMSSPALDNEGYLYIGGVGQLYKLKQNDGSVVWTVPLGEDVWSSPRLDKHGRVFIGSISGPVFCVDRETGRVVWSYETEGPVIAAPLITADHQYFYDYGQAADHTKEEL